MNKIVKRAYDVFPFKKQAFLAMRYFYRPPRSLFQRLNFDGPFQVQFPKGRFLFQNYAGHDHVIENEIFWNGLTGGWERVSLSLWIELCTSSSTIFDVGANTGIYSLIAKAVRRNSNVFAFEPIPQIYQQLLTNIRLNDYDIGAWNAAASNRDAVQKIFFDLGGHTYTASLNRGFNQNGNAMDVQTLKLSTFIREHHVHAIDVMKIDVETHELEVLQGMEDFLDSMKPALLIEILTSELGRKIDQLLAGMGYDYYAIDEIEGPTRVNNLQGGTCRNFLICSSEKGKMLGLMK